ncbi:sensor histidine kinase [Gloeobacter kilaueensis]|uniref:histidine kinase n=1 Tax=Gloeobacter kilaueensis (strain ATCC BAA-2537 / CCAP 1431/1 / ULC 316 / JS1) TaxID=1183438 RepID=U5QSK0_GLOK1|nr:ATP-binding protein [Gloeobacter kilaueensis]AGY60710.1 OmpR family manganese sensing sensor histidine kinase [Gloeobacter kilaueensis JS1]
MLVVRPPTRNPLKLARSRLLASYIAVTAAIMALLAFGFYSYVRSTLVERIDDTLKHVVQLIEHSMVIVPEADGRLRVDPDRVFAGGDDDPTIELDLIYLEWFDPQGRPVRSTAVFRRPVPLTRGLIRATVEVSPGHKLRQLTVPVRREGQLLGYLRVSHQWFEVDKPAQQLFFDLLFGLSIAMLLISAGGWVLTEMALRPIREAYNQLKQFTADASHELRTPLAALQTNVQVTLADPEPSAESYRKSLEVSERLTRRMGRLVGDLLFLARNEGQENAEGQTDCNLTELLQQIVEEQMPLAAAAGLNVSIKTSGPVMVVANPDQMSQLFTNLLGNAIRYTPTGGQIALTTGREGKDAIVTVSDTGIGIAPEHLGRIFERFYRVDTARARQAGGTGLGLAIAKTIVENHQGQIWAESEPGKGTTLRVRLPARPGERRAQSEPAAGALPLEG